MCCKWYSILDMKKAKCIRISALGFGIVLMIALWMKLNQSPFGYLQKQYNNGDEVSVNELLAQKEVGEGEYFVFFVDKDGGISCAILKKKFWGYDIINLSSKMIISNNESEPMFLFSSYQNEKNREWIYWTVLQGDEVKKILADDKEMKMINIKEYGMKIFYITGQESDRELPPNYHIIYQD